MPLIDFHTHFFPNKLMEAIWRWFAANAWPIEYKVYADEAVQILKNEGVTQAVSLQYPHEAGMAESLNEWAFKLGSQYSDFIIPFGSVHPDDENKEHILKRCFESYQFKGLKIHCHVQKVAPTDPRMEPIYQACEDYNRILLIHCGTGPNFRDRPTDGYGYDVRAITGFKLFEKILKKYPKVNFVVPHLGYEEVEAFIGLLESYPNLYLDNAMAFSNYFESGLKPEWIANHADRILFGTDFPNIPYPWKREKENLLKMRLGKEKEDEIFFKNATSLLGL